MNVEVRLAKKGDLGIIHGILEEIQPCDISARLQKYELAIDSKFSTYLVAVSEEKVIGFLNVWHIPDVVDGGMLGIILDCYVSRESRHMGVGRMLLGSAIEVCKRNNVNKICGWIAPDNKSAISLMKSFGFSSESLLLEKK